MNAIRRTPILLSLSLALLTLLAVGCADQPLEVAPADETLLQDMATFRRGEVGHGLLVSHSGLVASLPVRDFGEAPLAVPARGLFYGPYRLLDGWSWDAGQTGQTDPGALAQQRPDRIERPLPGIGTERVILDPDSACGVILLPSGPGSLVRFIPAIDLRPIAEPSANATVSWSELDKALIASLPNEEIVLALVSNGGFAEGREEKRIEYATSWGPLEAVASVLEPGLFSFPKAKGAAIGLGVATSRQDAVRLARHALDQRSTIERRAKQRAFETLDRVAVRSNDSLFTAAAAWDIWWTTDGLLVGPEGNRHRLSRAPLPYAGDPVADTNTLPALLAIHPSDLDPARQLFAALDEPFAENDLEGYAYALAQLLSDRMLASWLSTDSALVEHARLLATYSPDLTVDPDSTVYDLLTRWDIDLRDAGFSHPALATQSGLASLLLEAMEDLTTLARRNDLETDEFQFLTQIIATSARPDPNFPAYILLKPPESWDAETVEEYRDASTHPRLSLPWYERHSPLHARRGDDELAKLAMRIWTAEHGLRFHAEDGFRPLAFNSSRWLAWHQLNRSGSAISRQQVDALFRGEYWSWLYEDPIRQVTLPGGAVVDQEVAARRLNVRLRDLIGLEWKGGFSRPRSHEGDRGSPVVTGFSLKPAQPLEFWKGRAVTFAIGQGDARIQVYMEPWEGLYRFSVSDDSRDMQVDLIDLPVEGTRLSGSFAVQSGRVIEITRELTGPGLRSLMINGVELMNASRQMIR
ncbi:hypothetical protein KQI63_04180 [bacterium]|nr:hypothetical protein [bacterium]